MMQRICPLDDLWVGEMRALEVAGRRLVLIRAGGTVSAFPDRCLHKGVALSTGRLEGCVLTCSAHEWQFDVRTGAGINPDNVALTAYKAEVRAGEIWLDVEVTSAHGR